MKTVATNLALRLSDTDTRQLLRDLRIGDEAKGKYFKTGSLVVDDLGEYIASIKSFIMLESDLPIIVSTWKDGKEQQFDMNNLFMLYGEIGRVWVRAANPAQGNVRVNYYISTDDEEASGYIIAYTNEDDFNQHQSRIRLRFLPSRTSEPSEGLPSRHANLTFGISKEIAGVPARIYSGYKRDIEVHYL